MKNIYVVALCLACAACAQMQAKEFNRGSETQQKYDRDAYECERDARNLHANDCDQMDMFERCMQSHGYAAVPGTGNKGLCARVF